MTCPTQCFMGTIKFKNSNISTGRTTRSTIVTRRFGQQAGFVVMGTVMGFMVNDTPLSTNL